MARPEIIEKLDSFLSKHNPLMEECHAVYLMVEIRKILDHENCHEFPLLRFYCDWTVHTEKTGITDEIKAMMKKIYYTVKKEIENPATQQAGSPVVKFFYMDDLRNETEDFLRKRNMPLDLVQNDNWICFVSFFVKVLEDQPIKNPIPKITLFSFIPAANRCVRGIIKFKQPIKGYNYYRFANAY